MMTTSTTTTWLYVIFTSVGRIKIQENLNWDALKRSFDLFV